MRTSTRVLRLLAAALLAPAGLLAYDFPLVPAPLPPAPAAQASGASPTVGAEGGTPTLFLEPFQDLRRHRELWRGLERNQTIGMEAEGMDSLPKEWRADAYGDYSLLWHRQLAQALADRGVSVDATGLPGAWVSPTARSRGAAVLGGDITALTMDKRGADGILGTNFFGDDYGFDLELNLRLASFAPGVKGGEQPWTFQHTFHDPTHMGRTDRQTFPVYFAQGLSLAAQSLADAVAVRLGLKAKPIPPSVGPGGGKGYWVNPKSGQRMDPSWNFDPTDGTPRKDFVFRPGDASASAAAPVPATPSAAAPAPVSPSPGVDRPAPSAPVSTTPSSASRP